MAAKKGHKKLGGRKKGTKNIVPVNPITFDIIQTMKNLGHDPAAFHLEMLKHSWDRYLKALLRKNQWGASSALMTSRECNADLMKYVYPTRKSVDANVHVTTSFSDWVKQAHANKDKNDEIDVTPNSDKDDE